MRKIFSVVFIAVLALALCTPTAYARPGWHNYTETEPDNIMTSTPNVGNVLYDAWFGTMASADDVDWYKVTNTQGAQQVTFEITLPSPSSTYLYGLKIYAADGTYLGRSNPGDQDPYRTINMGSNEYVYVQVYSTNGTSSTDQYTLGSWFGTY